MSNALPVGHQIIWSIAFILGAASIFLQLKGHRTVALIILTLAALALRVSAAFLDPFLNMWDEVFHAVAARNMMEHPLTPMLHHEPAMPITDHWPHQHIWLHKPPFFLWLMALSMKIFGTEVWAVRIPSVILTTLLVPITWRMGTLLRSESIGFASAFFIAFSYLLIDLTAGAINTDHNDAVFIVMVACSIWALMEYLHSKRRLWPALVGVFCAAAILTKWWVGLLAFLPWGLILFWQKFPYRLLLNFVLALSITGLLVGLWLVYTWRWFPAEAASEFADNWLRLTIPFEGHRGSWSFHFEVIRDLIPPFSWWIMIPAIILLILQVKDRSQRIILISIILAIHIFFGLAQTKMVCYTMVLLPFYMIAICHAVVFFLDRIPSIKIRNWSLGIMLMALGSLALDPVRIVERHTIEKNAWRRQYIESIPTMDELATRLGDPERTAVFNLPRNHYLQFMFDHRYPTWDKMPTAEDVARLRLKGYDVYAIQDGLPLTDFPVNVIVIPDTVLSFPRHHRI